jgi:hypothetical protein
MARRIVGLLIAVLTIAVLLSLSFHTLVRIELVGLGTIVLLTVVIFFKRRG